MNGSVLGTVVQANVLLALAAAVLWGGGDYSGGMGVKSAGGSVRAALQVVLLSHATSFIVLLAVAGVRGDAFPRGALLGWGIAAGVAGGVSLTCFYMALSRGAMGASAAVSGLLAAAIPAALSMLTEGSPGWVRLAGFSLAGVAIWLIAAGPKAGGAQAGTMVLAVVAGAGFGLYFIALKIAGAGGLVWPMATARMGSLTICGLMLLGVWLKGRGSHAEQQVDEGGRGSFGRRAVVWALSTALLDTSGNLLFIAATRAGRLDVAAVLASLYPASTIVLAAVVLGERPSRMQVVGMGLAAAAVVVITI